MWEPPDMRLMNWKDILLINGEKVLKSRENGFQNCLRIYDLRLMKAILNPIYCMRFSPQKMIGFLQILES